MEKKKIVFLYTEIAGYFLACVNYLIENFHVEVTIIRYEVNKEAPFQFQFHQQLTVYNRNDYLNAQLLELVHSISPHIIVCSGWIDKGYLHVCKQFKNNAVTVLTLDNQWKGSIKQRIATCLSFLFLHNRFSYAWVPGQPQAEYAERLGFGRSHILTGFYSCDFSFFYNQYLKSKEQKQKRFPKKFIYAGRYVEQKGIRNLWNAFIELQKEHPNEWELWCIGTGDIQPVEHPKIKHLGFIQPQELPACLSETGVFILPSIFEPWGVVVHEFAAAGFPIICSQATGAHTAFVENNFNGYIYNPTHINELKAAMLKIINSATDELIEMGNRSVEKAKQITPETWAKQLTSLL